MKYIMNKKKFIVVGGMLLVFALLLPIGASAATKKMYTNKTGHFTFYYPSTWSVVSSSSRPTYVTITPKTPTVLFTALAEKYNSDTGMFTKEEKAALKKGFTPFVTQFLKDYKSAFGPNDALPNDSYSNVNSRAYTLRSGYHAWRISADRMTLDIPFHDEIYLITKDKKTIYLVWSMLFAEKLPLPTNPYTKDFNALVKSFAVTSTTATSFGTTSAPEDARLPFAATFPQQILQLVRSAK